MQHRLSLPEEDGMLFDFLYDDDHVFWMENVHIPLDIIFIDSFGIVVHIHDNATPNSRSEISCGREIRRVIEVNGGWCAKNQVGVGTMVEIQGLR